MEGGGGANATLKIQAIEPATLDAEVKGAQAKEVRDEIKAKRRVVPGGTAGNPSLQGKATAEAGQTRS